LTLAFGLALVTIAVAQQQQSGWNETRFHRVHLRNGNFIDGTLVQDLPGVVVLKLSTGEMSIRKDQIARDDDGKYLVVLMKMRTYNEAPPPPIPLKEEVKATPTERRPPQPPPSERRSEWKKLPPPSGSKEEQLVGWLERLNGAPVNEADAILKNIVGFGKEGVVFLTNSLPALDEGSRRLALAALIEARSPDSLPIFRKFLGDKNASVRSIAIDALASLGESSDASGIRPLIKDADAGVRASAVKALGKFKDRESFDAIAGALADTDDYVRTQSFEALGAIAKAYDLKEDFQRAVLSVLERASGPALIDIIKLASKTGEKSLGAPLARLLSHQDAAIRAQALIGIAQLNAQDVADQVLAMFTSEREYWPRIQVAGAAGALKIKRAIEPLIQWMGDEDKNIQAAASRALQQITGQNYGLSQEPWMKWWESTKPR
jgi:HEAT repeat protein